MSAPWWKRLPIPCLILALGLAGVAAFRFVRRDRAVMNRLALSFARPWRHFFSGLVDGVPFSCAEALCALAIAGVIVFLAVSVRQQLQGENVLIARLIVLAAAVVWVYLAVCLLWGTEYFTDSFEEQSGLHSEGVTVDQLEATALWFCKQVNNTAETVTRDDKGQFCYTWQEIFADTPGLYDGIVQEYPFLDGDERRAKPAAISRIMSVTNFTGYLFPGLGESTLNVDCPTVFLPVTIAHEFSHQRGVAQEQQANFVGVEASVTSGKPEYVYSGWLFGYLHLTNALYETAPERYWFVEEHLCPQAKADMAVNNAYWAQFEKKTVLKTAVQTTYENMLYSYDQHLGMKSYGACVDLLVAKYCPQ